MADYMLWRRQDPPGPGKYDVLVEMDDGRLEQQTERWHVSGEFRWWGPGCCEDHQDGAVIAWREIDG